MNLVDLVERSYRHVHRQWAQKSGSLGLSQSEYEYLRAIKDEEDRQYDADDHGQHLQDVVQAMGVKKASASAMVVKLEDRGLVERVPCQYDARAQHILLTPQGNELLSTGRDIYRQAAEALLQDCSDAEATVLSELK